MPTAKAAKERLIIPIATKEFRAFIGRVLRSLYWDDIQTPQGGFNTINATKQTRKKGHGTYDHKFELEIEFSKVGGGAATALEIAITEEGVKGQTDCKEKLAQLVATLEKRAQQVVQNVSEEEPPDTYGNAKFAEESELVQKGYITDNAPGNRLLLAPREDGRFLTVPVPFTNMHATVCGPTGAGKSTGFFIPNLIYRTDSSVIVTEATAGDEIPELYNLTSGWRQFKRNKIYFFNPGYARGTRINPLDRLKTCVEDDFAQVADELANLVIQNTTPPSAQRGDPIWDKSEKHLLWIMIMHVSKADDPSLAHLGAIRELLRKQDKQIKQVLKDSNSDIAREEYDSFLYHSSENFRHGVFAGLLQRLNPWLSDVIQTMTSATDLDLAALQKEKFSFYLSVPSRKAHLKPIAALIFNFLLDLALEKHFDSPPALLLDEFTNYGAIYAIDDALSLIRKRNLPVVLGFQAYSQLVRVYTKDIADNIMGNIGTNVFFRPALAAQAEMLSDALGDRTIQEVKTDDGGRTTVRELGKALMSPREIQTMEPTQVIVMTKSTNPIKTTRFDHNSCPAPAGFDAPELPQHKLLKVEKLNDDALKAKAKSAKAKAEQEMDFVDQSSNLEGVFASTRKTHKTSPIVYPPDEAISDDIPIPDPEPKPKPKPKPIKEAVDPAKKKTKRKASAYDEWDIPG